MVVFILSRYVMYTIFVNLLVFFKGDINGYLWVTETPYLYICNIVIAFCRMIDPIILVKLAAFRYKIINICTCRQN